MDLLLAVRRVLGELLRDEGFTSPVAPRPGRVTADRGRVVLEMYYLDEEPPPRSLVVALGVREDRAKERGVGLWWLLGDVAPPYDAWTFDTQETLEAAVTRVRDEVLTPFAAPLWRDETALGLRVDEHSRELQVEYEAGERARLLASARRAFDAGHHQEARDGFILAGDLSPVDAKRLQLARRALGDGR